MAEYFQIKDKTLITTGLGAQISAASTRGDFPTLLLATIVMALMVVTINRLVSHPLYRLAETKYRRNSGGETVAKRPIIDRATTLTAS